MTEQNQGSENWLPKTRNDWVEMFADGIALNVSRREEAEAKAKASAQNQNGGQNGSGGNDSGDSRPGPNLAERLLGIIH